MAEKYFFQHFPHHSSSPLPPPCVYTDINVAIRVRWVHAPSAWVMFD